MTDLPTLKDVENVVLQGIEKDSPFRKGFERAIEEFKVLIEAHAAAYWKKVNKKITFANSHDILIAAGARDAVLKLAGLKKEDLKSEED